MIAIPQTHIECADSCVALYAAGGLTGWDYVNDGYSNGQHHGIFFALKSLFETHWRLTFRGSVTRNDWLRDLIAVADPITHDAIGPVHPGGFMGLPLVYAEVMAVIGPSATIEVTGHSLGAIRAAQFSGLMVTAGRPPALMVAFEEPKPGFQTLTNIMLGVDGATYRNGDPVRHSHDPVTDVPFELMIERFTHSRKQTDLFTVLPIDGRRVWDILMPRNVDFHHMPIVAAALRRAAAGNETGVDSK